MFEPGQTVRDDPILWAAHRLLMQLDRASISMVDIAKRAGVSRATVYRRWSNAEAVVVEVFDRESFGIGTEALERAQRMWADGSVRAAAVEGVMHAFRLFRDHPYLLGFLQSDPEYLVRYTMHERSEAVTGMVELVRLFLLSAPHDGTVKFDTPNLAETIVMLGMSVVLNGATLFDTPEVAEEQLRFVIDRVLAP